MSKLNTPQQSQKQTVWSLTCFLGGSLGVPSMMLGGFLAKLYGNGVALSSVLVGNFILWLVGLAILSMVEKGNHALENIGNYLGKTTGIIVAVVWVFAFLMWYVVQLKATSQAIEAFFPSQTQHAWVVGGLLGLIIAVLSMGGLGFIKKVSAFAFPYLIGFAIYSILISKSPIVFTGSWGFSFIGILAVILTWLPFTVSLPTIFRYAFSKDHSVFALTLITVSHVFFQVFAILTGFDDPTKLIAQYSENPSIAVGILTFLFIILACVLVNMLNIYFARPGLDSVSFDWKLRSKHLIIGLVGTGLYILFQETPKFLHTSISAKFLEEMLSSFIAILGVILLFDFFIKAISQHRPRPFEKFWSSFCWLGGCVACVVVQSKGQYSLEKTTLIGMATCSIIFLIIVFVEETVWSIQHIRKKQKIK